MIAADLHLHSRASDGLFSPREVMRMVADAGLRGASLTDHDTVAGVIDAEDEAGKLGIDFISGIEISAGNGKREVHILGYGFDPADESIREHQAITYKRRHDRVHEIVERLQQLGHQVSLDRIRELVGDGMPGRPHVARAMVEDGIVQTVSDAFRYYLSPRGQAFIPKEVARVEEAIQMIHTAGGVAVLAHPGHAFTYHDVYHLAEAGLGGVETSHPSHTPDLTLYYQRIARRFGLIETGGSDYHGRYPDEKLLLGRYGADISVMESIRIHADSE